MSLLRYYRAPALSEARTAALLQAANDKLRGVGDPPLQRIQTECAYVLEPARELAPPEVAALTWLLGETFEPEQFGGSSFLAAGGAGDHVVVVEVGPRLSFSTAWSTNAVSICRNCGIPMKRMERFRRYRLSSVEPLTPEQIDTFVALVHDRMTETRYLTPLASFASGAMPAPVMTVPVMAEGRAALERVNTEMGLAFDTFDLDLYHNLFANDLKRDPTTVELFDLSQSNSEHSRHWFFKGRMVLDGEEQPDSLMQLVASTLTAHPDNSVIAFADNSSTVRGGVVPTLAPREPGKPSPLGLRDVDLDLLLTAETHNFPSGVAPFPGAETGTGGRIRDTHATGRGSLVVAGVAGYCVGSLCIDDHALPWEDRSAEYPRTLASPHQIIVEASNGASDYGNKFGEPVITGFARSFGLRLPNEERREWIKPIMFTAGVGLMDHTHVTKGAPEPGMLVVKLGGPAYRIGIGGGAASSMVQGQNKAELDFNAVQRGDAEMEQKMNRVIRACVELGAQNPIVSIHDQGAGGNGNVLKEIVEPAGAVIEMRNITLGDPTLSALEIWGAEYQESNALLVRAEHRDLLSAVCARERAPVDFVGTVTGDRRIVLHDANDDSRPVDIALDKIGTHMPRKTFESKRAAPTLKPFVLPPGLSIASALNRVLRLLSVGSKRFLTNKVDRSVTGLVAQQQCVGPLHIPLANCGVIAQSHFATTGVATAVGEQPLKGLISTAAMARMTVGEAVSNLVWAPVTRLEDAKCSANWMWAAKLPGEGAAMYDACRAMRDCMVAVGVAVDGGKDSLSMAARVGDETVKAPGALVVTLYCPCTDIRKVVTPDIKRPGASELLLIDLAGGASRLGGSALAQVYKQIGDQVPDMTDPELLRRAFQGVQRLIADGLVLAGHDRSDGGLVTTLLEMAFAGNCGVEVTCPTALTGTPHEALFAEELGWVLEVASEHVSAVITRLSQEFRVPVLPLGRTTVAPRIILRHTDKTVLDADMTALRDVWEETSFRLEEDVAAPACVRQERLGLASRRPPPYALPFTPAATPEALMARSDKPRVAVVREEGSNGDREMAAALYAAGLEPWDVTMTDLAAGSIGLDGFRGVVFVGGFSYGDVCDSAKGWAAGIRLSPALTAAFDAFYARPDTFSLGVCNGAQLLALLGWVPFRGPGAAEGVTTPTQPRFVHNASGRFESRWSTVHIMHSPSILLKGMAGATMGVWVAHGEGRALFPQPDGPLSLAAACEAGLAPVRYVDDDGRPTEAYPFNPNGSPQGVAALCSPDGRHLAIMPHPERAFATWQWPWMPAEWRAQMPVGPWLQMFQNARAWCDGEFTAGK